MREQVALINCSSYQLDELKKSLEEALFLLGGWSHFLKPGDKVFLKVNLLNASSPEKGVITHPHFVEAVINLIKKQGALPLVGESPGGINTHSKVEKLLKITGLGEVCERTETPFILLDHDIKKVRIPQGRLFRFIEMGREALEADVLIALPKLKTHGLVGMTGGVKVLFGLVPGLQKAQYHLKVPDQLDFSHLLLDVYLAAQTKLFLMDAIEVMEGKGPSNGEVCQLGLVLASPSGLALDVVAAKLIAFNPTDVLTNRAALERGILPQLNEIEILGESLEDHIQPDFKHPPPNLQDKIPDFLRKKLRNYTTPRPFLHQPSACTGCGVCKENCLVGAISFVEKKPSFNYQMCIRCFCCHELCAKGALDLYTPFLARLFQKS